MPFEPLEFWWLTDLLVFLSGKISEANVMPLQVNLFLVSLFLYSCSQVCLSLPLFDPKQKVPARDAVEETFQSAANNVTKALEKVATLSHETKEENKITTDKNDPNRKYINTNGDNVETKPNRDDDAEQKEKALPKLPQAPELKNNNPAILLEPDLHKESDKNDEEKDINKEPDNGIKENPELNKNTQRENETVADLNYELNNPEIKSHKQEDYESKKPSLDKSDDTQDRNEEPADDMSQKPESNKNTQQETEPDTDLYDELNQTQIKSHEQENKVDDESREQGLDKNDEEEDINKEPDNGIKENPELNKNTQPEKKPVKDLNDELNHPEIKPHKQETKLDDKSKNQILDENVADERKDKEIEDFIFVHTELPQEDDQSSNFSFLRLFIVVSVFFVLMYVGYYHRHRILKHFSGNGNDIYYQPLRTMQHNAVD